MSLRERFAIVDRVRVEARPGGMSHLLLDAAGATAEVALQGGQVLRYRRAGEPPLLWVSREAIYAVGKALRGGVPVCWPWFGPHPSDLDKPQHGFVRTMLWELRETGADDVSTWARLGIADSPATRALWPHAFDLELDVRLGQSLDIALTMRNTGDAPFSCSGALHSYLTVGDVAQIAIEGLEGARYIDKVDGGAEKTQSGPVTISGEVDRVYQGSAAACVVRDPALGRRIMVEKAGSQTTVVWNPGPAKAAALRDMADDEYTGMVCVETANAADDVVTLAPGAAHTLRAVLSVEAPR